MILNILVVVTGMFIALVFFFAGNELGKYQAISNIEKNYKELSKQIEEIDDFPRTLDGKFFSREIAIKNMSMKDGD